MMQLKIGVKVDGIQPEIIVGMIAALECFRDAGQTFTVTSICDGKHKDDSLHYKGQAIDIRTRDLKGVTAQDMATRIKLRLGGDYDVIYEGGDQPHLHLEYDPT